MSQIEKLTPERLIELNELAAKATQVVAWRAHSQYDGYHPGRASVRGPFGRWLLVEGGDNGMKDPIKYPTPVADLYDDAKFAAAAMNSMPHLVDELTQLRTENMNLKSRFNRACTALRVAHDGSGSTLAFNALADELEEFSQTRVSS